MASFRLFTLLSTALLSASAALANSADPTVQEGIFSGAVISAAKATRLELEREDLDLRCDAGNCRFAATYALSNPHDQAISTRALFVGQLNEATIGGKSVVEKLEKGDAKRVELLRTRIDPGCSGGEARPPLAALRLRVPAKSKASLVMKGTIRLEIDETPYLDVYGLPGPWARHLGAFLLTAKTRRVAWGCYDLWPISTWQGDPKIQVSASWPLDDSDVTLVHYERKGKEVRERVFDPTDQGTRRVVETILDGKTAGRLETLETRGPRQMEVVTVGVLGGVGARSGRKFGALHRYGVGLTYMAFFSTTAGIDLVDGERAPFVLFEAHTPAVFLIIPSINLGVGGQKQPDAGGVGARFSFGLQWPLFGIQTTFDPGPEKARTYALTFSL